MKTNVIKGNFSVGDIDEVSALLGELKLGQSYQAQAVKDIQATATITNNTVKEIAEKMILSSSSLDAAHRYIEDIKKELKEEIRPFIEDSKTSQSESKGWKDAMNWVSGIIGSAFTLFGAYVAKMLGFV
jgi:hypothetical protein